MANASGTLGKPKAGLKTSPLLARTRLYRMGQGSMGAAGNRALATPLMLTALVDAFSILVIFLLVQFSPEPNEFEAESALSLPTSVSAEPKLGVEPTLIKFISGQWIIGDQTVGTMDGVLSVMASQKGSRFVLMADGNEAFDQFGELMSRAAGQGFGSIEIAVEKAPEEKSSSGQPGSAAAKPSTAQFDAMASMKGKRP